MAIGRKRRETGAKPSKAPPAEREAQVVTERSTCAGALQHGDCAIRRTFETVHEVSDGKQRADNLAEILSEAVYAYLKNRPARVRNRGGRANKGDASWTVGSGPTLPNAKHLGDGERS